MKAKEKISNGNSRQDEDIRKEKDRPEELLPEQEEIKKQANAEPIGIHGKLVSPRLKLYKGKNFKS